MNVKKIEKVIKINVWDCGIDNHFHKTKKSAIHCFSVHRGNKPKTRPPKAERMKRTLDIAKSYCGSEYTMKQVGQKFNLTSAAVGCNIAKTYRLIWKILSLNKQDLMDFKNEILKLKSKADIKKSWFRIILKYELQILRPFETLK